MLGPVLDNLAESALGRTRVVARGSLKASLSVVEQIMTKGETASLARYVCFRFIRPFFAEETRGISDSRSIVAFGSSRRTVCVQPPPLPHSL